jgi:hypothetical protein
MRRAIRHAAQVLLLGFVAWYLFVHWSDYQDVLKQATPSWGPLLGSGLIVFVAYAVLIQTWRLTVQAWGAELSPGSAARIWFVSSLGKYLPGKYWSIAAMGALAHAEGVSAVAAVGSSLVVQLVNIVTGFAVVAVTGTRVVDLPVTAGIALAALALSLVAAPRALPLAVSTLNRLLGRSMAVPHLPPRALWWAVCGTTLAWLLYGLAFQMFAHGISAGAGAGAYRAWAASFVASYLVGFIAVFSPGGLGVREVALAEALQRTGLATGALVALLVAGSRIWLTLLEIIPGVLFLLVRPASRPTSTSSDR